MSTDVLLVRHAIAWQRDASRWPDDRERPLTRAGRRKFERTAEGLARWVPKVDLLITSPLVRARETADVLTKVAGWPTAEEADALAPEGSPEDALALVRTKRAPVIALVGHEPALSMIARVCLIGAGDLPVFEFRKGGVCHIRFESSIRAAQGKLAAFVPPRMLRKMR